MTPYVNIVNGKPERFYIQEPSGGSFVLVYRPTHSMVGCFSEKEILRLWRMNTEEFYAFILDNIWFRLPKNGNYDFMFSGNYKSCEENYERRYLAFTEKFIKKHSLPRLYEEIPYGYIQHIKQERRTMGGELVRCSFNETQEFTVSGECSEFAELLFDRIYKFKGHTKVELYRTLNDLIDVNLFIQVLRIFRRNGVPGISALKRLHKKDIARMLVIAMNKWRFV